MLILKACGEFVEESAGNIITAFTGRHSDLEAGNQIHDLLKTKSAKLLSTKSLIFDHRLRENINTRKENAIPN